MTRPIQLTDAAFLMLRRAIGNADTGIRLTAADVVPAAELVEAEYAIIRDADGGLELCVTPVGDKYMKMIDGLLRRAVKDSTMASPSKSS